MKTFEQFFNENEILRQICKVRVKIAKSKSKKHLLHLLTTNPKFNYHKNLVKVPTNEFEKYQTELVQFLSTILPPRKKWVKLGSSSRRKPHRFNEFLTSNDRNFYSLLKTIKVHTQKKSTELWFINLQNFIQEIQSLAVNEEYSITPPIVFPKLKERLKKEGENECRPICMFSLTDRIILSITNKFLTRLFDKYFQDSSYAFRSKKNEENKILSHHDSIKGILKYKSEIENDVLFVVECDMKKFYDTVNHKIAIQLFDELIQKAKADNLLLDLSPPINIFKSYLSCFSFNIDIPKSSNTDYWESYRIPNGEFTWVNDVISNHYIDITQERIGVPQGGALSGLIANIYLNRADIELKDLHVHYFRFCDDMIIITDSLDEAELAKERYEKTLNSLKLFPHKFKLESELVEMDGENKNFKPFWNGKSKGPYRWGKIENNCFPWIGFVGYEINFEGDVRVRKKSFEKELKKQKLIIDEIKDAIKEGMRKPKGTATESAINRLIGMSVGRIGLDNFDEVSTDLCWKNGFKELTLNKHSVRQIKQFDRNRSKLYYKLLEEVKEPEINFEEKEPRQPIKYNKPFSYYYQILEREKKPTA